MKSITIVLLMLTMPFACHAASAWKWVDDKGVTHYGDAPPPSATKAQPVDARPYGATNAGGCSTCDWRTLERVDRAQANVPAPGAAAVAQGNARGMDYNVYIRLKSGMDEGELMSRAGAPDTQAVDNVTDDIVKTYYYMPTSANPYTTTVKLRGGRITAIDRRKKD